MKKTIILIIAALMLTFSPTKVNAETFLENIIPNTYSIGSTASISAYLPSSQDVYTGSGTYYDTYRPFGNIPNGASFHNDSVTASKLCATIFPSTPYADMSRAEATAYNSPKNNSTIHWDGSKWILDRGDSPSNSHLSGSLRCVSSLSSLSQSSNIVLATNYPYTYNRIDYTPTYSTYSSNSNVSNLDASCYPLYSSTSVGNLVNWKSNVSGGNQNYYITWNGVDGLNGNGNSISKSYDYSGTKTASITVISGNQTITRNCSSVEIYGNNNYYSTPTYNNYSYNNGYPYNNGYYNNYYPYNYNSNYNNYYPLVVSCSANTTFAPVGSSVIWQSSVSGGNGQYSYNWAGTDIQRATDSSMNVYYNSIGQKNASVTVSSGGQTITQICSNVVNVGVSNYTNYGTYGQYQVSNYGTTQPVLNNGFQIACYPDKVSAKTGTNVTWSVEAIAPYGTNIISYIWDGSENLSGGQMSTMIKYGTTGVKSANITVVASNGQRANQVCGSSVNISNTIASNSNSGIAKSSNTSKSSNSDLSASAILSLGSVPWALVGILIIIILLFTILYLIFNRKKI